MRPGNDRKERGSVTAFVAIIATALVLVSGLAYDGGQIVLAEARARSVAAKAARAGAQQVDTGSVREGNEIRLDARAAYASAEGYLQESGCSGTVTVRGATVIVTVTIRQPMAILPVGDRSVRSTDSATATDGRGGPR